jgi:nucleotide-binding universal stress UspA family protein
MILIAYDGSDDARAAIDRAGELLNGQPATILTVWERFVDVMARAGAGLPIGDIDYESIDRDYEEQARRRAEEGAERAQHAGLRARATIRSRETSVAGAILAEADEVQARLIILGTRGLTGVKSLFLGSVSHALVQHATRPVMIVPSPDVAAERALRTP